MDPMQHATPPRADDPYLPDCSIWSEEMMSWMANLFSCVETWKTKGLDVVTEAANYV